ncbi:hypothetical protein [Sphingosinicella terrae]|uniref:hypothetical protein n=1 Tax=Sphingosinicella terrae TaxID=2172047 RepID=UPI000E0DF14D|nr:hypothetical protein [Sphingosinicella terrae]
MADDAKDAARGPEGGASGGGLNGAELQRREKDALGGEGGSSGGGTLAGAGDPSGGTTDREKDPAVPGSGDSGDAMGKGKLAAARDGRISGGEAIGAGAGRAKVGSGTPADTGDLGGGGKGA